MTVIPNSRSVGDFLKAVYMLQQDMERVSTNALAETLAISPPSVTDMARRMVSAGLVDYRKYYGVLLTEDGERIALRVIRRHRLIELYLVTELGYALHEVHEEAEVLEHAVSDRFVDAIAERLGDPTIDPHGDPIPSAEGVIKRRDLTPLTNLPENTTATIARYVTDDMIQHILERGLTLGARIEITARDPFDGPLTLRINGEECVIGHNVAASILVEVMANSKKSPN